ncbi:MAG: phosphohistidine phosphatase SixA [Verrucomicrobia bacterium]|nr:phosphohistidine phosphatase SixA [Verrucomicrobiota bacterium]
MKLYFLRHAEALDGLDDAARPLSPRGKKQADRLARFLCKAGIEFDAAFSSPLVRARQTAERMLKITNKERRLKLAMDDALLNGTSQREFDRWLGQLPAVEKVLLVGHEPSLSARVRHLLGGPDEAALKLSKGALACVELGATGNGALKFLIAPKLLGA